MIINRLKKAFLGLLVVITGINTVVPVCAVNTTSNSTNAQNQSYVLRLKKQWKLFKKYIQKKRETIKRVGYAIGTLIAGWFGWKVGRYIWKGGFTQKETIGNSTYDAKKRKFDNNNEIIQCSVPAQNNAECGYRAVLSSGLIVNEFNQNNKLTQRLSNRGLTEHYCGSVGQWTTRIIQQRREHAPNFQDLNDQDLNQRIIEEARIRIGQDQKSFSEDDINSCYQRRFTFLGNDDNQLTELQGYIKRAHESCVSGQCELSVEGGQWLEPIEVEDLFTQMQQDNGIFGGAVHNCGFNVVDPFINGVYGGQDWIQNAAGENIQAGVLQRVADKFNIYRGRECLHGWAVRLGDHWIGMVTYKDARNRFKHYVTDSNAYWPNRLFDRAIEKVIRVTTRRFR